MSGSVKVRSLLSHVGVAFTGDHPVANLPTFEAYGQAISEAFGFAPMVLQEQQGTAFWGTGKGVVPGDPPLRVAMLGGNELQLFTVVEGTTDDAGRALSLIWARMLELARELKVDVDGLEDVHQLGRRIVSTIAVAELSMTFTQLFPVLGRMDEITRAAVERHGSTALPTSFHTSFDLRTFTGPNQAAQKVVIEPRTGTPPEARVFHTISPLSSEEHLQMLETICAEFAK